MPEDTRETQLTQTVKGEAPTEPGTGQSGDVLLGRFKLVRLVGRGGMGEVYEARDLRLHATVALKTVRASHATNTELLERLRREVQLARAVTHPQVCRVFDFHEGTSPGGAALAFVTMEYLDGETLADRLRTGPFSPRDALNLLQQMADGLAAIHAKGLVHRDFKPGNVMLVLEQGKIRAVVTDFGIARPASSGKPDTGWEGTEAGAVVGSPAYMSPEQRAGGEVTARTDIYALGLVACEMVAGRVPAAGALQGMPLTWKRPLRRALDVDPARRYDNARKLVPALEKGRKRLVAALGLTLTLGAVTLVAVVAFPGRPAADRHSIAVLPLTNLGGSREDDDFGEGLTEDIVSHLAKIEGMHVISRTSTQMYKGVRDKPLREIAAKLGAGTVLEGTIRRVGGRVRIVTELIDARTDQHLWAETYNLDGKDALDVQADVAAKVATALALQLSDVDSARMRRGSTTNVDAYGHYLRGVSKTKQRDSEPEKNLLDKNLEAIAEFQQAVALDPRYALAHAWLASAYMHQAMYGVEDPRVQGKWADKARAEVQKAKELEPSLSLSPLQRPEEFTIEP